MKKAITSLFLNKYKPQLDGACPLSIRVSYQRVVRYYPTGQAMKPKAFDRIKAREDKGQVTLRSDLPETKIYRIASKQLETAKKIIDNKLESVFTFGLFEQLYFSNSDTTDSLSNSFDQYINELKEEGRIGTAVSYQCAQKSLETFKKGMKLADITDRKLKEYEAWMIKQGNSRTTVGFYLRSLRTIFNRSNLDRALYPFGKGKNKYSIPTGENKKKALTLTEIAQIFNYAAPANSSEEMARDYWVFLYLCNGMNIKDMCKLKRKDLNGDMLNYLRSKTERSKRSEEMISVSLKPQAKAIIQKWGQVTLNPESYVFPHLTKGLTPEREREIIQLLTQTINKHMKRIAVKLEINKPVTTYYARHSFATVLKRAGVSTEFISEMMGHSNVKVTQNYLDGFEKDMIHETTNVLTAFK
jgi:integrase/recombinase XerD